ncbi:ZIP family metal transporter, partial [Enterococcus faecium]|nr:ZIP family metal transporter [Enterococcus faecium]
GAGIGTKVYPMILYEEACAAVAMIYVVVEEWIP